MNFKSQFQDKIRTDVRMDIDDGICYETTHYAVYDRTFMTLLDITRDVTWEPTQIAIDQFNYD